MKLKHLAITAFALSMSAAFAGGDKHHAATDGSMKQAETAPAGYADKSAAAEPMSGQKDTKKAQKKAKKQMQADASASTAATAGSAGIVTAETAANPGAPAGYADKSTSPDNKSQPKDTQAGQVQPDAGLGASAAAPAQPGAPAGYSDQAAAQKPSEPQDTQKAQEKSK